MSTWHLFLAEAAKAREEGQYADAKRLADDALTELIAERGEDGAREMSRLLAEAVTRRRPNGPG